MTRCKSRTMASESDTTDSELTVKSDHVVIFFLVGLSKSDNIVKLKSAVGYNEEKLSKEIVNDLNTMINVLWSDIAKKQDQHPRATSGIPDNKNLFRILTTATALVLHPALNLQLLTIRPLSQTLSTRRLLARRQVSLVPLRAMTGIPTLLNRTTYLRRAMRRSEGKSSPFWHPQSRLMRAFVFVQGWR